MFNDEAQTIADVRRLTGNKRAVLHCLHSTGERGSRPSEREQLFALGSILVPCLANNEARCLFQSIRPEQDLFSEFHY